MDEVAVSKGDNCRCDESTSDISKKPFVVPTLKLLQLRQDGTPYVQRTEWTAIRLRLDPKRKAELIWLM